MKLCAGGAPLVTWQGERPVLCDLGWEGIVLLLLVLWALYGFARLVTAVCGGSRKGG